MQMHQDFYYQMHSTGTVAAKGVPVPLPGNRWEITRITTLLILGRLQYKVMYEFCEQIGVDYFQEKVKKVIVIINNCNTGSFIYCKKCPTCVMKEILERIYFLDAKFRRHRLLVNSCS